jgi:hypothetical protein
VASKQVEVAVVSSEMPTKARVPGFELLCGQWFKETFPNTLP